MTTKTTNDPILVVGGTGKTGRRVAEKLGARGLAVRAVARSTEPRFDWDDEATWDAALSGVRALYVTYAPDLAVPGAAARVTALVGRAVERGARRMVLLSGRGEPQVFPAEEAVRRSGAEWTILRSAFFAQNFSEGLVADDVRRGVLAFPAGDTAEPFVDVEDLADVAVAALTEPGHAGQIYDVTGPRLLTFGQAIAEIAGAAGRVVAYRPVSVAEYVAVMAQFMPAEEAAFLGDLFAHVLDGHNAHLGDGVRRALGREARDFREFARDAAARGVWS